jgi:hypothetical protein
MQYADEFRRCLLDLDVRGMRRLWRHVSPHLPQPESDYDTLVTMHLARLEMNNISADKKRYSKQWLEERETTRIVSAVGTAVGSRVVDGVSGRSRAKELEQRMSDAVEAAAKEGVDLDKDAGEVRRRIDEVISKHRQR